MPNRLALERSPYLRLHGHDPVDWYPWGEEALAVARNTGRPIFLSVGYASCHWCHVMQRESFKDPAIAEKLAEDFVSVKVDRESRPDVDETYMAYVIALSGRGGWPMTIFLTPGLVPIAGGTYYPPERSFGMPSFSEVIEGVRSSFASDMDEVRAAAEEAAGYLSAMFAPGPTVSVTMELAHRAVRSLSASADPRNGGFGRAPKFPQAPVVDFLLAYHEATGDPRSLAVAEHAVEHMVRGGIYDQAGGGLARYATDDEWLVPHFEKMLYDNGMLLITLARLHRLSPRQEWAHLMRQTADFLERDLRVDGGYASSLSADTRGTEGATYLWTYPELSEALTADELALAEQHLGVRPTGNWEGTTILTRRDGRETDAENVDALLGKLLQIRGGRPQPDVDDKVIVSWNALVARGLIAVGGTLGDAELTARGVRNVEAMLDNAVDAEWRVLRVLDSPDSARVLEDATGLALAALDAWKATGQTRFLTSATSLFSAAVTTFYEDGTWYMTGRDTELPVRPREQHDSPAPSGPSLAAMVALELREATGDTRYGDLALATLERLAPQGAASAFGSGTTLEAIVRLLSRSDLGQ